MIYATLAAVFLLSAMTHAQDTVTIASGGAGGYTKFTGRIVDYTGRQLLLELAGRGQRSFPAGQVLHVETPYGPKHTAADEAFAKGEFDRAWTLYRQAVDIDEEPRRWVRRQIFARIVRCHRALDRTAEAGAWFLLLSESDPDTPYFDCIPLAWTPRPLPTALEETARQWIQREEPAAVLLGASHLLGSTAALRAMALAKLRRLTTVSDQRIAKLALAQTWRTATVNVDKAQLDTWAGLIEKMPEALAAGPYFVLGRARAQRQQWEPAALAWMRVAILYPQQRTLAARSLADAGRALQQLGRTEQALRLYREVIVNYPQTSAAAEARSRLEAIGKNE